MTWYTWRWGGQDENQNFDWDTDRIHNPRKDKVVTPLQLTNLFSDKSFRPVPHAGEGTSSVMPSMNPRKV